MALNAKKLATSQSPDHDISYGVFLKRCFECFIIRIVQSTQYMLVEQLSNIRNNNNKTTDRKHIALENFEVNFTNIKEA